MLKLLRKKENQKKIFIPLTVMVIASFGIWGIIITKEEGDSTGSLGQIGNKTISIQNYLKSYKAVEHQMQPFYGEKAGELRRVMNLKGQAWDRILLLDYAKKEKIKVSDTEVVDWIGRQFAANGKFDDALYKRYVEVALHSNPRDFEEEVRENLMIARVAEKHKSEEALQKLLNELRNNLKLNLETMKKLFPPEETELIKP